MKGLRQRILGPPMHPHDGRSVSNFIVQAPANQPITLHGTGRPTLCRTAEPAEPAEPPSACARP